MNVKVLEVVPLEGRGEAVADGAVVVSVLVAGGHTQDVGSDVGVLLHILDVFLQHIECKIRPFRYGSYLLDNHLTVKKRRIVIDISYLYSEGTDSLQARLSRVYRLHCDRHGLAVLALAVEHLVGEHLARLLVHGELGPLLVGLLHDGVLHLPVHPLVLVHGVHLDHGAAVGRALLYLGRVGRAVREHWLVVIHVGDEDDHDGGGGVHGLGVGHHAALHAALPVVHGGHVELVLVAVQVDGAVDETDDAGVGLDAEQAGGGGAAHKSECYSVTILK